MTSACFCVAKMVTAMLAHVDLCSGIGGFALGFQWAGLSRPVLFCDIEEWSRKVLAKHWPDVPISDDVKELASDPRRLVPDCDILTAGYPCQPFSLAGKRRGEKDDRHIWPEIFTIVQAKRPRWCVFENVSGHINMGLDQVLSDLEGEGYTVQPFVVPACAVDAPHRRDRVWIIAAHADSESQSDVTGDGEEGQWVRRAASDDADANSQRQHRAEQHQQRGGKSADRQERELGSVCEVLAGRGDTAERSAADVGHAKDDGRDRWPAQVRRARAQDFTKQPESGVRGKVGRSNKDVADANSDGRQQMSHRESGQASRGGKQIHEQEWDADSAQETYVFDADSVRCEGSASQQVSGFRKESRESVGTSADQPHLWTVEPPVGRVANGIPRRVDRLKGLGNAIVPQIAMQIGLTIKAVENG